MGKIDVMMKKVGLLSDKSNEFAKLSDTDKLVCLDIMERNSGELKAWVVYTVNEYGSKGIKIDAVKLFADLERFAEYARKIDEGEDLNPKD